MKPETLIIQSVKIKDWQEEEERSQDQAELVTERNSSRRW